jgi:hypothetical protein
LSTNLLQPSRLLAINLRSLQLRLPLSFSIPHCHEYLGLPLALVPCGFHCRAALHGSFTECVSNPAKFALSYLLIDVYLLVHFPQLFIRYDLGSPDLHDISQAPIYKGRKLSL